MRRHFTFDCEGARLGATLDEAAGTTGLLIVTGGNETRAGAWSGQSLIAAEMAAAGHPVLRFDRRGVGDSEGDNRGYRHSGEDIAAAIAALRREAPQVRRLVGFGNCDGAAALMLNGGAGLDALVLANPWTIEDAGTGTGGGSGTGPGEPAAPAADSLRAHYRQRLRDPAALLRVIKGGVAIGPLVRSLLGALRRSPPATLAGELRDGLARFAGPSIILLAGRDRTAQTFLARWDRGDPRLRHCPAASHSFVEDEARAWLRARLLESLSA